MKTFDLVKELNLLETEGWSYVPFVQGNVTSFYTEIIENNSITIAWVSIQKKISKRDLTLHHFERQLNSETGINNSLPRLLIVTDGKKWFLSKPGSEQFTLAIYSQILVTLYNEIKATIKDLEISKETISLQKSLTTTLTKLKIKIRVYGENIQEAEIKPTIDLFSGTGHFLAKQNESTLHYLSQLTDDEQLSRYSKILHQRILTKLHPKQIQFLLQYPHQDVFVNPFFRYDQFLVCISKKTIEELKENHKQQLTFLIINQFADSKEYYPTVKFIEQEILPTLIKIDREQVMEFLTKERF